MGFLRAKISTLFSSGAQGARVELLAVGDHLLILAEVLAGQRLDVPPIVKLTSSV